MISLARSLVRELVFLRDADLDPATRDKVVLCLVDYLSCVFAGRRLPYASQAIEAARPWSFPGGVPVLASDIRVAPGEAAYLDSLLAASASRTDMHAPSTSHPAAVIFPVAFACAGFLRVSGAEFAAAVVAGYEAMGRLGRIVVDGEFKKRFRATSVLGVIGGALTASRLLGLDEDRSVNALSLAANTASGLMAWGHTGEVDLFHQPANAARCATTAALLARAGATSSETILESPGGYLAAFGGAERCGELTRRHGDPWEIRRVDYKPVPACVFVQAAAFAAKRIVDEHRFEAGEVEKVRLRTFSSAIAYPGCDNPGPIAAMQPARMSLQFAVASVLAHAGLSDRNFSDVANPSTRRLASVVEVDRDEQFDRAFPERQGAQVDVHLRGGATIRARVDDVPPVVPAQVLDRFRAAARAIYDEGRIEDLEAHCQSCFQLPDVGVLLRDTTTATN